MKISVKDAFSSYTYRKEYDVEFTQDQFSDFPDGSVCKGITARVTVSSESGVVTCKISVSSVFETTCSRCVKQFDMPLEFTTEKIIRREQDEDFEDVIYADPGLFIDITEEIRTQIFFEFPTKPLCKEDCKGLCSVCGCDLNVQSCSCDNRTIDPRLAVLNKLIDK
ncbi:MAG: DUF177 domain-containing protein [Clostridia bacterium]|nr:DUF177 domain-containing protein [Clostridia bacterium]